MHSRLGAFLLLLTILLNSGQLIQATLVSSSCNEDQLKRCADNAEPLLKDSELVVPDSQKTVNQVCSLWNDLTTCVGNYTQRCMSRQQRMDFDRTFKDPASSMASLCQNKEHRKEYLRNAPCVKKISTEGNYCGNQYRFLIDLVSGSTSTIKQICCARAKFKNCILLKTPSKCDSGRRPIQYSSDRKLSEELNATTMAVSILDKSLAFISQRCSSASFREADCPGIDPKIERTNSKGPLDSSELQTAASGESSQSQGSNFQLDQGSRINRTGGKFSSTKRPTTPKRIAEEKPKTDKLSSASKSNPVQQTRPGSNLQDGGESGGISINKNDVAGMRLGLLSLLLSCMQFLQN